MQVTATTELTTKAIAARDASRQIRNATVQEKNEALLSIANSLGKNKPGLFSANGLDMKRGQESNLPEELLARLELTDQSLKGMVNGIHQILELPDPIGEEFDSKILPNGIQLSRKRIPLGVIGAIFEARPEVPVDMSALCLKSGNSLIMRGSQEAINTNRYLGNLIREALGGVNVPSDTVQMIESPDRSVVREMLRLDEYIDLLIPRGGVELVTLVAKEARMPAITGGIGVCHTYIDATADDDMSCKILLNAKVQSPAKCNALDAVLVNAQRASQLLPKLAFQMTEAGVRLHCDPRSLSLIGPIEKQDLVESAQVHDWGREFLSLQLAVKVVDSIEEAMEHIHEHGSGHTEAIVTNDNEAAARFTQEVDAAVVLVNASTRFNDGGQFGLGAEVAISTNKIHARGPMGLRELTTYKWIALGNGQVRQ